MATVRMMVSVEVPDGTDPQEVAYVFGHVLDDDPDTGQGWGGWRVSSLAVVPAEQPASLPVMPGQGVLWNAKVPVVALVHADSAPGAVAELARQLRAADFDVYEGEPGHAFESEPV